MQTLSEARERVFCFCKVKGYFLLQTFSQSLERYSNIPPR
ncbi:hypothetical protein CP10743SC13_0367 [Chlamydia psittaci 10_743_SC13]|nr:hypothetical protein CP10743SC13_0367 [Chlamydia psittaci 10_743_SC13]